MNIIIMILLISFLILVHELGHLLTAKMLGFKVTRFGFGLPVGPTLYQGKIGDIEILVHALLLGGYVSFPDDDEDAGIPKDSPELFQNQPAWKRALVLIAGVAANMVCAVALIMVTGAITHKLPSDKAIVFIKSVGEAKGASVKASGLQKGDIILRINNSNIIQPFQTNIYAKASRKFDGYVSNRAYDTALKELQTKNPEIKNISEPVAKGTVIKLIKPHDEEAMHLSAAALMGIERIKNDSIRLNKSQIKLRNSLENKKEYIADGQTSLSDVAKAISDTRKPMFFTVKRGDKVLNLPAIYSNEEGLIGIERDGTRIFIETDSPAKIVTGSLQYTWINTKYTLLGLEKLITGQIPVKELRGIVAATKMGGDMIEQTGILNGILLTAIISINLAVMNLLPIPALDGGHLMFLIIEKFKGKPLDERVTAKISNFFFLLLIILMMVLIFNDIFAIITKQI